MPPVHRCRFYRPLFVLVALTSTTAISLPAFSAAGDFLETGTNYYRQGNYLAASAALHWAIKQAPGDANAHYLLANSYSKLGRLDEARVEYQKALHLPSDGQIHQYCEIALGQINYVAAQAANQAQMQAAWQAQTPAPPAQRRDPLHQKASQLIDQQADSTSLNMLNDSNANAASWQRTGAALARLQQGRAETTAQEMSRTKISGSNAPAYSKEDIDAARQQGVAAGQTEVEMAHERGAQAVQYAKAKVWETQAAAKNLQDQLDAPTLPGSAKLKAEGTSLYVRNFDTNPLTPADALSAGDRGKLQVTKPLFATPKSLLTDSKIYKSGGTGKQIKTESSVFGQVMP